MEVSSQCFAFIPPTHPSPQRKIIQLGQRTLPTPTQSTPQGTPPEDWAKPCGRVPTRPPLSSLEMWERPFLGEQCKHPLPNTPHAQSDTPAPHSLRFLPEVPPPHNGPLSSGHSTPACPLGPRPKTAAGSESSKEELVSQLLSWPTLPSLVSPRVLARSAGILVASAPG